MIHVVIAEDQAMLRESLSMAIGAQDDMEVMATFKSAEDVVDAIEDIKVDLALLDICTEDGVSGLTAAAKLRVKYPSMRIVLMTAMPEITFVERARQAGADSFIYKNEGTQSLLAMIRSTMEGYSTFPSSRGVAPFEIESLTEVEVQIIRKACEAKGRKEIATELFLSEGTVKRHISEILAKTGYDSITKLAVHLVANGYILPDVAEK